MKPGPLVVAGAVAGLGLAVAGAGWALTRQGGRVKVEVVPNVFPDARLRTERPRFVVIHHTDTSSPEATRKALHAQKLSTHFEVTPTGRILMYLEPTLFVAEHAGWANGASIGVDVTHRSGAAWPGAQVTAVRELVLRLVRLFGLPPGVAPDGLRWHALPELPASVGVVRHRNVRPTACPEDFPMPQLGPIVALA